MHYGWQLSPVRKDLKHLGVGQLVKIRHAAFLKEQADASLIVVERNCIESDVAGFIEVMQDVIWNLALVLRCRVRVPSEIHELRMRL